MRLVIRRVIRAPRYVIFACAIGWLSSGHSQETGRHIPLNAHYSAGDRGWVCDRDFTQVAGLCMADSDVLGSQSAFETYDGQWRCRPGYHRTDRFCVPGVAPEHAAFVGGSDHWECDWGYQKTNSQCLEIKPPSHAYIEAAGHEWVCFPGFARIADQCAPAPNPAQPDKLTTPADAAPGH